MFEWIEWLYINLCIAVLKVKRVFEFAFFKDCVLVFHAWPYIFPKHNLIIWWVFETIWPAFCDIKITATANRSHYKMLYKGSKRQQIWRCPKPHVNQLMYYWGIGSLSVWWAKDLNLTGRESGRWESTHAPINMQLLMTELIFDGPPICFYWMYKHK